MIRMVDDYRKLSIQDKRKLDLARARESSVPCPGGCGLQLLPVDLRSHLETRCAGPAEPGPTAKWLTWREALALDACVYGKRLSRWAKPDLYGVVLVRSRGSKGDQQYLERDLLLAVAKQKLRRRRQ